MRGFHSAAFAFAVSTCSRWFEHDSPLYVRGSRNARGPFIYYVSTFLGFFDPLLSLRKHIFSTEIKQKLPSLLPPPKINSLCRVCILNNLESRINIPPCINIASGKFGKKNKWLSPPALVAPFIRVANNVTIHNDLLTQ